MLQTIDITVSSKEKIVNDLNSPVEYSLKPIKGGANVYGTNCFRAVDGLARLERTSLTGLASTTRIPEMCPTLPRQSQSKEFLMFEPILFYGLRATYLARKPARYRSMSASLLVPIVSHGYSGQCIPKHSGRRQRKQGLAHLRRLRPSTDWDSPTSLRQRRFWGPAEANSLRFRFHHHRPVSGTLSLGKVPQSQRSNQVTYLTEPARQYPRIYPYYRRKSTRRQYSGLAHYRIRFLLYHGSSLSGFQTTLRHSPTLSFLCNTSQTQSCGSTPIFPAGGQVHRTTSRSNHIPYRYQYLQRLPGTTAAHFLLRREYRQTSCLSDQQLYLAGAYHCFSLQGSMASRAVFQVDKTAPAYQGFLRHIRECGEDPSLDCRLRIRPGSHLEETASHQPKSLHNSTGFKHPSIRERTALRLAFSAQLPNTRRPQQPETVAIIRFLTGHYCSVT